MQKKDKKNKKKEETTVEEYNWPNLLGGHKNSKMT